ncbi:MAG: M23 family metallopeptidase, partial [Actinocatenispora sp.]
HRTLAGRAGRGRARSRHGSHPGTTHHRAAGQHPTRARQHAEHSPKGHHRHGGHTRTAQHRSTRHHDRHHHVHRSSWTLPVHNYTLTSRFGPRWGTNHPGVDLAIGTGLPVHAAHSGTVSIAGWDGGYGNGVEINVGHGLSTVYGHNSRVVVAPGQHVRRGQLIAFSGSTGDSTGPHCHFELRRNGIPFNPLPFLRAHGLNIVAHSG